MGCPRISHPKLRFPLTFPARCSYHKYDSASFTLQCACCKMCMSWKVSTSKPWIRAVCCQRWLMTHLVLHDQQSCYRGSIGGGARLLCIRSCRMQTQYWIQHNNESWTVWPRLVSSPDLILPQGKESGENWVFYWLCWVTSLVFWQANQIASICNNIGLPHAHAYHLKDGHKNGAHYLESECHQTLLLHGGLGLGTRLQLNRQ